MDEAVLEAHADLRLAALGRHALFSPTPGARAHVLEKLGPVHREGTVRTAELGDRLVAVLAWRHDPDPWYGQPVSTVALDYDPRWDGIVRWLDGVLDAELPRMVADLDLVLDARYREAYRALRKRGVGLDSLQLFGDPREGLSRLLADRDVPSDLSRWGFELTPLEPHEIDEVIALSRASFVREPQYCWFGANESFLVNKRAELERDLASDAHVQRVVRTKDGIRGHFSASVRRDDPLWGPVAGMSLNFAPELRGRGMLRAVYRHLLEAAIDRGARAIKGGTSQPPVLHLAAVMRRPLHAVIMRRGAKTPEAHFAPYEAPT
jgi:GNAT superfamily N-acetyltransferase